MQGEKQVVVDILLPILISLTHLYSMDWKRENWTVPVTSTNAESLSLASLSVTVSPCLFVSLWHRICLSIYLPLPFLFVSLSAALSSQRLLHLSGCVIEPCVPSLSAKRLADCLHFHVEGCEASMAVVWTIDWDPSKPSLWGSCCRLSSGWRPLWTCPFYSENGDMFDIIL